LVLLAACAPTLPESGAAGVGFQDYTTYELRQAQQAAAERGRAGFQPRISDEVPASAAPAPLGAPMPTVAGASAAPPPLPAAPPAPQTAAADPATPTEMSDEQDFSAVAARESIQSDADRLAENRAKYQQVEPTALPERAGASDTMVIDFALATSNSVGQKLYKRGGFSQARFARACAKYGSQDVAQEDFLKAGGPERDSRSMDPDGDGFACFWDPTPFRNARLGAVAAPIAREVLPGGG
jgi:hypothetical protein